MVRDKKSTDTPPLAARPSGPTLRERRVRLFEPTSDVHQIGVRTERRAEVRRALLDSDAEMSPRKRRAIARAGCVSEQPVEPRVVPVYNVAPARTGRCRRESGDGTSGVRRVELLRRRESGSQDPRVRVAV